LIFGGGESTANTSLRTEDDFQFNLGSFLSRRDCAKDTGKDDDVSHSRPPATLLVVSFSLSHFSVVVQQPTYLYLTQLYLFRSFTTPLIIAQRFSWALSKAEYTHSAIQKKKTPNNPSELTFIGLVYLKKNIGFKTNNKL